MAGVKKTKSVLLKKPLLKSKRAKATAKPAAKNEPKKEFLGALETTVGTAKFSNPEVARLPRSLPQELPSQYGVDKMVLMVRDPWWLYTYWELKSSTVERLKSELK